MLTTAPRGTRDILLEEAAKWQYVEEVIRDCCRLYGYGEIRPPLFEHTELFQRSVGEATDIVEKEMYITLKTAAVEADIASGGYAHCTCLYRTQSCWPATSKILLHGPYVSL